MHCLKLTFALLCLPHYALLFSAAPLRTGAASRRRRSPFNLLVAEARLTVGRPPSARATRERACSPIAVYLQHSAGAAEIESKGNLHNDTHVDMRGKAGRLIKKKEAGLHLLISWQFHLHLLGLDTRARR